MFDEKKLDSMYNAVYGLSNGDIVTNCVHLLQRALEKEGIGKISSNVMDEFRKLYNLCDDINGNREFHNLKQEDTTKLKGIVLELLARKLFEGMGGTYELYGDLRTSSNELDVYAMVKRELVPIRDMIDSKFHKIVCECKNHAGAVKVDYTGKFFSLMEYTHVKFGILFSWNGLTGDGSWEESAGLIKKLFLSTSSKGDPVYIIDFNKKDFEQMLNGGNFFEILEKKCTDLEMDVDLSKSKTKHEKEKEMKKLIDQIDESIESVPTSKQKKKQNKIY